jgi:YD repeat-containing protein
MKSPVHFPPALFSVSICIASLFFFKAVCAQDKSLLKTESGFSIEMKGGKEIQIKRHFRSYDEKGNIIDEIDYDSDGRIKEEIKYEYSSRNEKIKETRLSADGKIVEISMYEYDTRGNRISRVVTDANKKVQSKKMYVYEYY